MKHRLFAAINLPLDVSQKIEKLQLQLDQSHLPISWERTARMHLTLVFMGRLADEDMKRARGMVANVATQFRPHTLKLLGIETLFQRHEPSIVYVPVVDEEGELTLLQQELTRRVDEITPQPRRKFFPHITIGWIKKSDPTSVKQSLDRVNELDINFEVEFMVDKIHLYESFLSRSGSSYSRLESFNLGNSR